MNPFTQYKKFTLFFTLILIFNFVSIAFIPDYFKVAKAMIMASLLGFYAYEVQPQSKAMLLAMIAALFGDIFLLFGTDDLFMIGMLCFLITHIMYIIRFKEDITELDLKIRFYIPIFLILLAVVNAIMSRHAYGDMFIYILIYSIVIAVMASSAYLRRTQLNGYVYVYIGAIMFLVSDILLSVDKFQSPIAYSDYLVMGSYMVAQYFIVTGIALQKERPDNLPHLKTKLRHSTAAKINKS